MAGLSKAQRSWIDVTLNHITDVRKQPAAMARQEASKQKQNQAAAEAISVIQQSNKHRGSGSPEKLTQLHGAVSLGGAARTSRKYAKWSPAYARKVIAQ